MNPTIQTSTVLAVTLLVGACKGSAPTPEPSAQTPAAGEAAKPSNSTAVAGHLTPEQQAAIDRIPRPEPDADGNIDLGAMTVHVPDAWEFQRPRALMRRAQFSVPGDEGSAEAVVFFVGRNGAGPIPANIDRWVRQFTRDDGSVVADVVPTERKIAGFDVIDLEVAGNYSGGMTPQGLPGEPESDQRLVAAIVSTPDGPYYIKLLGPDETVSANKTAFEGMLKSMKPKSAPKAP